MTETKTQKTVNELKKITSNLEERRISKVKFDDSSTVVMLEEKYPGNQKAITVTSFDARHADFTKAVSDLVPLVISLLRLPPEYSNGFEIIGCTFSENEHQGFGAVITALKQIKDISAPLVLNTPHTHEDERQSGLSVMPTSLRNQLRVVYKEAELFVGGKRAQADLFQQKEAEKVSV